LSDNDLMRGERLQIMLSGEELAAVDDFRFKQRMPSRAAAVRELLRLGLASVGLRAALAGEKSSSFGVLDAATEGYQPSKAEMKNGGRNGGRGKGEPDGE